MFLAAPVMRHVEAIELPSQRRERIVALRLMSNEFIMNIMLEDITSVKQKSTLSVIVCFL